MAGGVSEQGNGSSIGVGTSAAAIKNVDDRTTEDKFDSFLYEHRKELFIATGLVGIGLLFLYWTQM